jgi:RHS repeat-associated protein
MTRNRGPVLVHALRRLLCVCLAGGFALAMFAPPAQAATRSELEQAVRTALREGTNPAGALAELRALDIRTPTFKAVHAMPTSGMAEAIANLRALAATNKATDGAAWARAQSRLLGEVALLRAALNEDRNRVRELELDATMQARVDAAQAAFEARVQPLLQHVAAVADARVQGKQVGVAQTTQLLHSLEAAQAERPVRLLGVRGLPNLRPSFAPRSLPATVAAPPSFADPQAAPPVPADFAAEPMEIAPDVLAKAQSLGRDYVAIHDFVRGSIRTEWYAGARRTPSQTLQTGRGNDAEQAALLVALLRASGAAARYVHGVVELPLPMLASMTGLDAASDIGRLLSSAGIAHEPVFAAGSIRAFRVEQVVVAAYLPFANFRGTTHDLSGAAWIPLAPALKPHHTRAGTDLLGASALDVDAFIAASIATSATILPLQQLRTQLEQWAATTPANGTIETLARLRSVDAPELGLLPSSVPGQWLGMVTETPQLTDTQLQHVHVRLFRDASANATLDREVQFALRDLADQRLTLSFQPATPADQDVIHRYGGLALTPAYLVRLRTRLMRDGEPVLVSTVDLMAGDAQRVEFELVSRAGSVRTEQNLVAGGYVAIDLDARLIAPPVAAATAVDTSDGEFLAAELLANLGRRYQQQWQQDEALLADWAALERVRPLPSLVLVSIENEVERVLDLPRRLQFRGVSVDAALRPMEVIARLADADSERRFMRLNALHGSALEHWVFENEWSVPSVSTTRGLHAATLAGTAVIDQTGGSLPASVELPLAIENELTAQLARGWQIQVAAREVVSDTWHGAVWRATDPDTGDSGYFIAGGYAGGATVAAPETWLLQFLVDTLGAPYSPAPNEDPESAFFIDVIGTTDAQMSIVNTPLEDPLAVRVTDRDFRPVKGARVGFKRIFGNGTIGNLETEVEVVTDAFGVARVSATPAPTIVAFVELFLDVVDQFPNRISLHMVQADLRSGVRDPKPVSSPIRFYGQPGPVVRLLAKSSPRPSVGAGGPAGFWWIQTVDEHDNPVFNIDISYSSTLVLAAAANAPPHFYTSSTCSIAAPLLADCGQPGLTSPTSPYAGDDVEVIAGDGDFDDDGVNAVIHELRASADGLPPLTRNLTGRLFKEEAIDRLFATDVHFSTYAYWAARPGETSPAQTQLSFFRHYESMPTMRRWDPNSPGPYAISLEAAGQLEIDASAAASGIFKQRFTAGAAPQYSDVNVSYHVDDEDPESPKHEEETSFPGPFAIDFAIDSVSPSRIELDGEGFPTAPVSVAFRWARPADPHYAIVPTIFIERDGEPYWFYGAGELERDGPDSGVTSVELPKLLRYDPHRTYTAHVVLHERSAVRLSTEKLPLRFGTTVVAGYDLVKPNSLGPRGVEGRYPTELEVIEFAQVANDEVCGPPQEFAFEVFFDANVNVQLRALDQDGEPSAFTRELFNESVAAGTHTFPFILSELPFGSYKVEVTAFDPVTGETDTRAADVRNDPIRPDNVPLAHAVLKGVDLQNGHLSVSRADIAIGGRGPGLSLQRTYSSGSRAMGAFGRGWSSNLDARVIDDACGQAWVIGADGGAQRFASAGADGDGTLRYEPLAGYHGSLSKRDNQFDYHAIDGTHYAFPQSDDGFRLTRVTDTSGNWIEQVYGEPGAVDAGKVRSIQSRSGRTLTVHWRALSAALLAPKVIERVDGPGGLRVDYLYDSFGYLISAKRAGSDACAATMCEVYGYTDAGSVFVNSGLPESERTVFLLGRSLTSITQTADNSVRRFAYEPLSVFVRRAGNVLRELPGVAVTTLTEADGSVWSFDYEALQFGETASTTTVTDGRGKLTTYQLNPYGAAEVVTDFAGSTRTTWDFTHYKPLSVTDALGAVTTYTYDAHGNTINEALSHPSGAQSRSWTFHPPTQFAMPIKNRPSSHTDARGIRETMTYNGAGQLNTRTRAELTERFDYASNGDATSSTDFNGHTTTRTFDQHGYLASSTDATGALQQQTQDARGRMQSQTDANGNTTAFVHDSADRVIETRHPETMAGIAIEYSVFDDSTRTRTDADALGRPTVTTHDALGRVVQVRHALNATRTLDYDGNGNLEGETDFRGNVSSYSYDDANRLTTKTEPLGRVTTYTHNAIGQVLTELITGPESTPRQTTFVYAHPRNARTSITRAGGSAGPSIETYALDPHGNALSTTNANNHITTRIFDAFDRVTSETLGGVTTTHAYDGNGNLLSSTRGAVTRSWTYDAANREETATDGNGKVSRTRYYPNGAVREREDALGRIVSEVIDARNQVTARSGPRADQQFAYSYDLNGNRRTETLPNGREITHSYDELNRRRSSSDSLGVFDAVDYNEDGHITEQTDGGGHTTTFVINALGQRIEAQAPLDRTRLFAHSVHGELLRETSPEGQVTTHVYDGLGQRIATTLPADANAQTLTFAYDGLGQLLESSDGNGHVTTHTYDARGRKQTSTAPDAGDGGAAEVFTYDDQDDLRTHTDRRGIVHAYDYDREHRATRLQRAGVTQWRREHDAVGNVLTETDANGHTTTSTFDAANQRLTTTRAAQTRAWTYTPTNQVETQTDAGGAITRNAYNERDQLFRRTNPEQEITTFTVDGDGLQTTRTLDGETWTNTYDAAHRLTGVESPEGHATSYDYNDDDALTSITDANNHTTTLTVDSQGRITSRTYIDGATFSTEYDGNGNAETDTTPEHEYTRTFDALNRLRTESSGGITRTQTFDANGNRLSAALGSDISRSQTYDPHNRPLTDQLQTATSDYTLNATRDANGNRVLARDANDIAVQHSFDAHNRLQTSTAPDGATTNTWNADGTLARIVQANGHQVDYSYGRAQRITDITHRASGAVTLAFSYDYDPRGNRITESRTEAALPGQAARVQHSVHTYDRDDRLLSSTVTYQPPNAQTPDTRTEWTLDPVGNRKTETVTNLATNTVISNKTYSYNNRDQLERIDDPPNDLQVDYAYDDNGNREQRIVRTNGVITSQVDYTFDARDRLIQAQPNAPNEPIVQYLYDADDRRIARIETPRINGVPQPAIVTEYIFDNSTLLHEANTTEITDTYRRSAKLDRHIAHATNTVRHYQLDALDTPVALSDASGNTITATTFDVWGNPMQQTASGTTTVPWQVPNYNSLVTGQAALLNGDGQAIGFTGYQKDSATGLYYAGARFYDPLIGGFNGMDPAAGIANSPMSFHRYVYGNSNPNMYVDRDGRQAIDVTVMACNDDDICNSSVMAGSTLPFLRPSQMATPEQASALIETQARMRLFGPGGSNNPMAVQPMLATGGGKFTRPYVEHGTSSQLSAMQTSADLDRALGAEPNFVAYGRGVEATGEMAFRSLPPIAVASGVHTMVNAENGWQFAGGLTEATLGAIPLALAARAELVAARSEMAAIRNGARVVGESPATIEPVLVPVPSSSPSMSGPVQLKPPPGATANEIAQVQAYCDACNSALAQGQLSPTGRVSTSGALRQEASRAAQRERARAEAAGTPYQGHAGHGPDTTWTGKAEPPIWLDLSPRVNTSLGGQAPHYPVGYKPTLFELLLEPK